MFFLLATCITSTEAVSKERVYAYKLLQEQEANTDEQSRP